MEPQEEVPSLRQAVRQFGRLVRLIRPYWKPLAQGMMLALILGLVGMVTPYLTKLLIDEVYPTEDISLMHVLVGGIVAVGLSSTLLGTLRGYFTLYIDTRLNNATRLMFFNHLQHLTVRFFDQHQVGEINSRFMDVGRALESISRVFQTIFVQGAYLFLVPPVLFWLEWRLALVAIIGLPLTLSVTALSGRIMRKYWKRTSESFADLNAFQIETLTQIRTFKTMGLEHQVYRRAHGLIEKAMDQQLTAGGLAQVFGTFNGVLQMLNTGLFTWFGWTLILERGGNAADAAVATALALAVVYPRAGNLGGGGFAVWVEHDPKRPPLVLDFREVAPAGALAERYLDAEGNFVPRRSIAGPLAVGVPGSPLGLHSLWKERGSRRVLWADLVAPAVRLARDGFEVDPWLARDLARERGREEILELLDPEEGG